ncbi:MAG TPA: OmpA family protein [Syntrophales bacterium]|nr:OmpA family protein [Syntrophales bacterium]HOM08054.1 OmpA family protein [Syntrophales bacterium]HON99822.1 OmpA family protein [Syntrophales bacterium]HPQ07475.1 OmpA family protein [Syntrophales bacterium]HRS87440.1 OmpA family protein [Syntrophales bacterium]
MKRVLLMAVLVAVSLVFTTVAGYAQVRSGTFSVTPYVGGHVFDGDQHLNSAPAYGLRLGYDFTRYFGLEASGDFIRTKYDRAINVDDTSSVGNYRLEGILHLFPQWRVVPFLAAGFGGQSIDYPKGMANKSATAADYGGGLKFFLTDWFALRADVRHMFIFDDSKKNWSYNLGFSFLFGGEKKPPVREAAPEAEKPKAVIYAPTGITATPVSEAQINVAWKESAGATGYQVYRDGAYLTSTTAPALADSGLNAGTRYCYNVTAVAPAGEESEKSQQACATTLGKAVAAPAGITAKAVSDQEIDVAWQKVEGAAGYKVYRDGLYLTTATVPALADKGLKADTNYCYNVTAVSEGGQESDRSDQACATTLVLQTEEQKKEAAAAAAVHKEMMEKGRARINVEFDFDKAVVKAKYHKELKKFADVMKAHPELNVVIEGHTDNIGGKEYNQQLSLRRAESVRAYLIKHFGIEANRLTSKGYGMTKPIATNKTAAGRQKNRRVEAVVDYTVKK